MANVKRVQNINLDLQSKTAELLYSEFASQDDADNWANPIKGSRVSIDSANFDDYAKFVDAALLAEADKAVDEELVRIADKEAEQEESEE